VVEQRMRRIFYDKEKFVF